MRSSKDNELKSALMDILSRERASQIDPWGDTEALAGLIMAEIPPVYLAAPELLAACRATVELTEGHAAELSRAAIAKATGGK